MSEATPYQISLLHHTLGLSEHRRESYRNHFVAGNGHGDMRHLEALERAGLMERLRTPKFLDDGDIVFAVTDAGRDVAIAALPEPKVPTRYDDYRHSETCDSFGEYLCGWRLPEFETRDTPRGEKRGRWGCQYRMYRCRYSQVEAEVCGDWAATKKEARASYKAALKKHKERAA